MHVSRGEVEAINGLFNTSDDPMLDEVQALLDKRFNVILYGPPGTGKTHLAFALRDRWILDHGDDSVFRVTFHPAFGYEEFVRGYKPSLTTAGSPTFTLQDGVLLQAAERAMHGKTLLLIDEINRGDVSRIFGELITYIEADKRDERFRLSMMREGEPALFIPKWLYVLGTMNSADKSVSLLDVALRRRFALYPVDPDSMIFTRARWVESVEGIPLGNLLSELNRRLLQRGVEPDRLLGHALLQIDASDPAPLVALRERLRYDVHPLVTEYFFLDRNSVRSVLGELVDEMGRFRILDDRQLIDALTALAAPAATP